MSSTLHRVCGLDAPLAVISLSNKDANLLVVHSVYGNEEFVVQRQERHVMARLWKADGQVAPL